MFSTVAVMIGIGGALLSTQSDAPLMARDVLTAWLADNPSGIKGGTACRLKGHEVGSFRQKCWFLLSIDAAFSGVACAGAKRMGLCDLDSFGAEHAARLMCPDCWQGMERTTSEGVLAFAKAPSQDALRLVVGQGDP